MPTFHNGPVEIDYLDHGEGAPILLIHGFASNKDMNWSFPNWVTTLTRAGRRVIALDNRGHGRSTKLYAPEDYDTALMAGDARALLDHLGIARADVMGYSMGARITAWLAVESPERVRSAILGGLGIHLVDGVGLPREVAQALEAPSVEDAQTAQGRTFRLFAEQTRSDLKALAACIRGSRQTLTAEQVGQIECPVLIAIGTRDVVSGAGAPLAALIPNARVVDIPGRDHMLAVGDKVYKAAVLDFLDHLP